MKLAMSCSFLHFQLEKPIKFGIQSISGGLRASERPMCGEGKSIGSEPIPQMDYGQIPTAIAESELLLTKYYVEYIYIYTHICFYIQDT